MYDNMQNLTIEQEIDNAHQTLGYTYDALAQNKFDKFIKWSMAWSLIAIAHMLFDIRSLLKDKGEK